MEELGYFLSDRDGIGFVQFNQDYFKDFLGRSGIWPNMEELGYFLSDCDFKSYSLKGVRRTSY